MAARKLAVLAVPLVAGSIAAACSTSGDVTEPDAGYVTLDGSVLLIDGQPVSAGGYACAFEQRTTYSCPDITLAPTPWVPTCVDGDDCKSRVSGTQSVAGCTETVEYADPTLVASSCTKWSAGGGTLPALDSGTLPVCAPGTAAFTPTWHPPRVVPGACTQAMIASYRQCLDDATSTANPPSCAPWASNPSAANEACLACMVSNESDSTYGAIIQLPSETILNIAGCLAVAEGKTDGSGCGGAYAAFSQCGRAACLPTCPTATGAEISAESACEQSADTTVCQPFVAPAVCATEIQGGDAGTSAEQACFSVSNPSNDGIFVAVATALCGGG